MNWRKGLLAGAGILFLIFAIYLFFTPKGGYHTYYDRIFYDTLSIQSYDEKIVDVLLKNQTRYRFRLGAAGPSDVNLNVIITDSDGDELSILDFRDQGETIYVEFISNKSGNYSIYLKELDEGYSYTAVFSVSERFDDYYPGGGRYASINNLLRWMQTVFLAIIGIGLLFSAFWNNIKKLKKSWRACVQSLKKKRSLLRDFIGDAGYHFGATETVIWQCAVSWDLSQIPEEV